MNGQTITIAVLVAQAVITYLLAQPEVVIPPLVKVILGAAAVGLTAFARFLPSPGTPVAVTVSGTAGASPIPVTPVDTDPDA